MTIILLKRAHTHTHTHTHVISLDFLPSSENVSFKEKGKKIRVREEKNYIIWEVQ